MDRWRAAGALLALAACIACSAAAPTASNHTALDLYEGAPEGCYYNFQHYGEGDRIMTNEPCLNCTCHNRMLMCYLRVCPFTKPIGQDCTVEKRADQCCPIVTCPDVPVDLLTSTSTTSPAEYGATGVGKLDKYGCSIHGKYFPEGSKVPPTPNKPSEHCYCIRNMTTCVMQECTLHVDGCTPIYHKDVCCPVRYSCDHPEDEVPLLDDMSTTVRPTPGFLLTTTTMSPVTQMTQDCVHNDQIIADGASITTDKACEHCYCMKGDIVCVVQECGAPMENEGKNCTSLPPREGQCCPDTYICEGDEISSEIPTDSTTDLMSEKLTTLSPPRRTGVEGSGYRHETDEVPQLETSTGEPEFEGSGEEEESAKPTDESMVPGKTPEPEDIVPTLEEDGQYISVTTKAPSPMQTETTTKDDINVIPDETEDEESVKPDEYSTTSSSVNEDLSQVPKETTDADKMEPHEHVTTEEVPDKEGSEKLTTEAGESLNTIPHIVPEQEYEEPHTYPESTTDLPAIEEIEHDKTQATPTGTEHVISPITESYLEPEHSTPSAENEFEQGTTEKSEEILEVTTDKERLQTESDTSDTTSAPVTDDREILVSKKPEPDSPDEMEETDEFSKPEQNVPSTTHIPTEEFDKFTTEPDHAQNTVAVAEEENDKTTAPGQEDETADKITKTDGLELPMHISTTVAISEEIELTTAEPDKGLNTIPIETNEESSSQLPLDTATASHETRSTEPPLTVETTESQDVETKLPVGSESLIPLPETHITKGDQYTMTTEPSFRKEDEASVSSEKPKEESGPTTIKSEFIDEGLIPTSTHDEKLSTGTDSLSTDDEMTTIVPEYNKDLEEETGEAKQPTTESIPASADVDDEISPEKGTDFAPDQDSTTTTEKSIDVAIPALDKDDEEPSRIPGEGDCLLNGITYKNSSVVPSTNNCHTGCKCVSSIIKCDPIICSPPPDYMDNCQSIYDTPDSCCPTYVCDHPRETIPPQSDNQMSGTESPIPPPTIECRGDQCELSQPTKEPTLPSELCTSGNCLPADEIQHTSSVCNQEGCSETEKAPTSAQPTLEHEECQDGKCKPSAESCAQGECHYPPTHVSELPIKPCEGDDCKGIGAQSPEQKLCENDEECKKVEVPLPQTVPCEGDSCTNLDCGNGDCDSNIITPPKDSQEVPEGIIPSDCKGDEPCRRKDVPSAEELPSKCEGKDCDQKSDMPSLSQPTPLDETTEKVELLEETKPSQPTDKLEHENVETTTSAQLATEQEHIPTQHLVYETTEADIKTDRQTTSEVPEIQGTTDALIEQQTETPAHDKEPIPVENVESVGDVDEGTKIPVVIDEQTTDTNSLVDEITTERISIKEDEQTKRPDFIEETSTKLTDVFDEDHTDEISLSEKEPTVPPVTIEEDHSYKPEPIEDLFTKMPDSGERYTDNPEVQAVETTKAPDAHVDENTSDPASIEKEPIMEPEGAIEDQTDIPVSVEEQSSTETSIIKDDTDKLDLAEELITMKPEIEKEHTDKPIDLEEDGTTMPDVHVDEYTEKPVLDGEKPTHLPDSTKDSTPEPTSMDKEPSEIPTSEETTEIPESISEHTDKPTLDEDKATKVPDISEEHTDMSSSLSEEMDTKEPENVEPAKSPALSKITTELPETPADEYTSKPSIIDELNTMIPESVIEEHTDKHGLDVEKVTEIPEIINEDPAEPVSDEKESMTKPDIVKENTEIPVSIEEDGTKIPDITEDHTDKAILIEKDTIKPPVIDEVSTDKLPVDEPLIEDVGTEKPIYEEEHLTEKPSVSDEEVSEIPDSVTDIAMHADEDKKKPFPVDEKPTVPSEMEENTQEKGTSEPNISDSESTEIPDVIGDNETKKPIVIDEDVMPSMPNEEDNVRPIEPEKEESTDEPTLIENEIEDKTDDKTSVTDGATEKSTTSEHVYTPAVEEYTSTPQIFEEHTTYPTAVPELTTHGQSEYSPETSDSDKGTNAEVPETQTESEIETKLPETVVEEHTEMKDADETEAETPVYDTQTTTKYDGTPSESILEDKDVRITEETSASPDIKTSEPQDEESSTKADMHPHSIATESLTDEHYMTTSRPLREGEPEISEPSKHVTASQEPLTNVHEISTSSDLLASTESVTKASEPETIKEQEEIYTDIPEEDSSVTTSPEIVAIEPLDGGQPESLASPSSSPKDEESTTKAFEEDSAKPVTPETHDSDTMPEHEDTSAVPESESTRVTESSELSDGEKSKPESSEPLDEIVPSVVDTKEEDIKTAEPEVFTPEKEEMITSTVASAVSEPGKGVTQTEDSSITGEGETATEYNESVTEGLVLAPEKADISPDVEASSSVTPLPSQTPGSDSHVDTEAPISAHTKPSESYIPHHPEISTIFYIDKTTITESPEYQQQTTDSGKAGEPDETTGGLDTENEISSTSDHAATESPISLETKPQTLPSEPADDTVKQEEKTTEISASSGLTVEPEIYITSEQATTEMPQSHVTTSLESGQQTTEAGVPTTIQVLYTTERADIPEDTSSHSPESVPSATHTLSSEAPAYEEMTTKLSHDDITTKTPSLEDEYQPSVNVVEGTTEKPDTEDKLHDTDIEPQEHMTEMPELSSTSLPDVTSKLIEEITKSDDLSLVPVEFSETTPYLIELEEHTHKITNDISTIAPLEEEKQTFRPIEETSTLPHSEEDHTHKIISETTTPTISEEEHTVKTDIFTDTPSVQEESTSASPVDEATAMQPASGSQVSEAATEKLPDDFDTPTKDEKVPSVPSDESSTVSRPQSYQTSVPDDVTEKLTESSTLSVISQEEITAASPIVQDGVHQQDTTTPKPSQDSEEMTPSSDIEKSPIPEEDIASSTVKESLPTEKPLHPIVTVESQKTTVPEDESIFATTKATTLKQEEIPSVSDDRLSKPEDKPSSETLPPSTSAEVPKPPTEMQPTDDMQSPDEDGHFPPSGTGYGEPDYVEEDQAFGPGTCRYGGKVYVSAQQIPRDDPCDFCFCFRSDIICLQQSCPPPIHGCHEEPIQGFCCPRYECPVSMATTVNVTTTTTTTTTTLPPHFPTHSYKGAAQRRGCQIKGHTYKVGEVVRSSSGPCLHCTCGGDGQMKCDPKACTPEPMLRQMIAAAVSAKRRR